MTKAELLILQIGMVGLVAWLIRALILWVREAPLKPDPWGPEWDQLASDDLLPRTCLRCSAPHPDTAWFCPECGAPVGDYNNCNPYLGAFSLGEILHTGAYGHFRANPLAVAGYLVLPPAMPMFAGPLSCLVWLAVPAYWVLLAMNLAGSPAHSLFQSETPPPLPPPAGQADARRDGSSS